MVFFFSDWRVAGGQVTGPQSFEVYQQIMKNATNINTGYAGVILSTTR
jgi:hypothetical protein